MSTYAFILVCISIIYSSVFSIFFFFFFSSRRRHTRCSRDWSSDVCSSDLGQVPLALARVPGLDVTQSGVNDFNVNARGFNTNLSRKILVLQDGRDLATALVIQETWGALSEPLEDFGRIEVIRGPGSALYGANAYNGVINITTPAARDVEGLRQIGRAHV